MKQKNIFKLIFYTFTVLLTLVYILYFSKLKPQNNTLEDNNIENSLDVSYNGWLHTDGCKLKNEKNRDIQLRGVSSHGIEWFYDVITLENLSLLKNEWNNNVFRIAMYTDSNNEGYIYNPQENIDKVCNIIDMAVKLDMYVIVDWHILSDNDPLIHKEEAKNFFNTISKKYSDTPNVLYEICNEPNGEHVKWDNSVKIYAEEIIPVIRNNSDKSLIIVGTPDWCKDLYSAAENPLDIKNVVYSCHFYSGTHGVELRKKIDYCISKGIPIFISECGLTSASGDGEVYFNKFSDWITFLNSKNISWVYWSFSNKNESSAIIQPKYLSEGKKSTNNDNNNQSHSDDITSENTGYNSVIQSSSEPDGNETEQDNTFDMYLTESGKFVENIFKSYIISHNYQK